MDYGLKVSLDGYDISTTNENQLAFISKRNLLKVSASGQTTVNGSTIVQITHSLGYVPQFLAFGEVDGYLGYMRSGCASYVYSKLVAYADTTKLYIQVYNGVGGTTYILYYYIFHDAS